MPRTPSTLAALWEAAAAEGRQGAAYLVERDGAWHEVSWSDAATRVDELANGLLALGVRKGDRFSILSWTRLEWVLLDFALLSVGAVVVPIYPTSSEQECSYVLENAGVRGIAVDDVAKREHLAQHVELVLDLDALDEVEARGREHAAAHPDALRERAASIGEDDLASIVYTSGTTGPPKGCLLTHRAFALMTEDIVQAPGLIRPGDRTVLFLPLAHNFGRLIHFAGARVGFTIAFCPDPRELASALDQVRPDFLPGVPRIYEKLHTAVRAELDSLRGARRLVVVWALRVGRAVSDLRQRRQRVPMLLALQHRVADRLVYAKVKARLGGRLRFGISGAAPLAQEIASFFHALDVLVLEGYGLTEYTAFSVNLPGRFRFGTVGPLMRGAEIRFAGDGEILLRGAGLFAGYHANEEATREALTEDGWFRTGDIGELDDDGYLRITDRKKDLIATAGGKKVSPQNLENALVSSTYVSQALVVGDRRPYIAALVTLDPAEIGRFAHERGIGGGPAELARSEPVRQLVQTVVDRVNGELARAEQIKRFAILSREFSAEEGEVTPTLKLKRKVCLEHCARDVEALYSEAP